MLLLTNQSQNIVHEQSFDAWGRRRNPVDWSYNVTLPLGGVGEGLRGYTLHEHIDEFNLINMNGRVYDPVLGRFLQPDNYVQNADNLQNFNRYAYVYNNPLSYVDPSGQWIVVDDAIAAVVGGLINLGTQLAYGNVNSFGQGLSYFGVGAGAGVATLYGGPLAGGLVMGLGNNLIQQVNSGQEFDWNQFLVSGAIGSITSYAGASLGAAISPYIGVNLSNPILNNMLNQSIGGAIVGGIMGAASSSINGYDIYDGVVSGLGFGFATGLVTGFVSGLKEHRAQQRMPVQMDRIDIKTINDNDLRLDISKNNYKTINAKITSPQSTIDIWNEMAAIDPRVPVFNPVKNTDYASFTNSDGIKYSIYFGGNSNPNGWNIKADYKHSSGKYRTFLKIRSE